MNIKNIIITVFFIAIFNKLFLINSAGLQKISLQDIVLESERERNNQNNNNKLKQLSLCITTGIICLIFKKHITNAYKTLQGRILLISASICFLRLMYKFNDDILSQYCDSDSDNE